MTSLDSLMSQALRADPADRLTCPMGKLGYTTLFGYVSRDLAVLRTAAEIEPCADEILAWYTSVRIRELGDIAAQTLVAMGRAVAVVDFLTSIRNGNRD
jgi:hypothetical protein